MTGRVCFVFASLLAACESSVNLWVTKSENKALIGLATEIFYIQEGIINEYAMNFSVIIPPEIPDLHFNWERTAKKNVPYEIILEATNSSVLADPSLNISAKGNVPRVAQTFAIHIPCKLGLNAETEIRIRISFTMPRDPVLKLKRRTLVLMFRRTRVCRREVTHTAAPKREVVRNDGVAVEDPPGTKRLGDAVSDDESEPQGVLYIAIGSLCGALLVLVIIGFVIFVRSRAVKQRKNTNSEVSGDYDASHLYMQVPTTSDSCHSLHSNHHYATLRPLPECPSYTSQGTVTTPIGHVLGHSLSFGSQLRSSRDQGLVSHGTGSGYNLSQNRANLSRSNGSASSHPTLSQTSTQSSGHNSHSSGGQSATVRDVGERISEVMVDRSRVEVDDVIQEGSYGRIATGWMADTDRGEKERLVIKTTTENATTTQISLLLQEGLVFYGLRHKNLLPVLGVAVEERVPPLVLYPYMKHWNLKKFLHVCNFGTRGGARTLTVRDVVDMAEQVTQALLYLHQMNICHMDVAARNCCVDDSFHVKLADNALARDLFPEDYHLLGDCLSRPVRWMAIETIVTGRFTAHSDMWSFGVLLWELTTLAQQPYRELEPSDLPTFLQDGFRLAQPLNCPADLFSVMAFCWSQLPEERPSAEQVLDYLHEFTKQLSRLR